MSLCCPIVGDCNCFDVEDFHKLFPNAAFPQFINFSDEMIEYWYCQYALIFGSKVLALFCDKCSRYYISLLVLAHILWILNSLQVGFIAHATEGSVSVGLSPPFWGAGWWWQQTPFGSMIWQLISRRGGFTYFAYGPSCGTGTYGGGNGGYIGCSCH